MEAYRGFVLAALLLAEYLLVGLLFDVQPLRDGAGLSLLLGYSDLLVPLLLASATAAVLVGGDALLKDARALALTAVPTSRVRSYAFLHALSFAAFLALTARVVGTTPSELGVVELAAWAGCGLAAAGTLLLGMTPHAALGSFLTRNRLAAAAALLGGAAAVLLASASQELWQPLSRWTLGVVATLLGFVASDLYLETSPPVVGIGDFAVVIDEACSGYEGIGLTAVFLSLYLWSARRRLRFPAALIAVPLAISAVWLANSVRIAVLVMLGAWWSPEIAVGAFHSKAGWVLFCAITLGVIALIERSPLVQAQREPVHDVHDNPTAAYLMPLLTLIAASMVVGLVASGFDRLYAVPIAAALVALVGYRRYFVLAIAGAWSGRAVGIGIGVFVVWVALEPAPDAAAVSAWYSQLVALGPLGVAAWLSIRVVGSTVVIPVVEELAFRGYLLRRLMSPDFTTVRPKRLAPVPLLVSSLAFGLVHEHFVAAVLAGLAYGAAYSSRGRIGDAILAHATTNGLISLYVLTADRWSLWM